MSDNKQLKLGALLSYLSIFINIAAGLLYTPWMVEQIGQSQYGLYTLANSLITLFLVDFGLSSATARYISKYRAEDNQQKIDDFLGAVYKLYLGITAVIFVALVVLFFFIDAIYVELTSAELQQFKVVYIIVASFSVFNFPFVTFNGILTSYEKFAHLKFADILYRVSYIVSTVIALAMGRGLYALVALHAAVGLLVILYKFVVIKHSVPIKVNYRHKDKAMYKEIFSFSIWVTLSSLAQRLIFNITPSILGMVANSAAIAVFGIVATIESYVYTIITAINGMFMPRISRLIIEDKEKLKSLMINVGKYLYALNGLILSGFAVVGAYFIELWLGGEYMEAYWGVMLVLLPGMFYNSLQIANTTMVVTKKVNIRAYVNIITGVVNLILSVPMSKAYGVTGACASIFIAYTVRAVTLNIIYHRILPFDMPRFVKNCYIRMSVPVVVTIAAGCAMNCLIADGGWMMFFGKAGVTAVVYCLLVFVLGFDAADKQKMLTKAKRMLKR